TKHMKNLLEFEVVVYLKDDPQDLEQLEKLQDLGLNIPQDEDEDLNDRIVSYSFSPDQIIEVRQSFVKYKGNWENAVVCGFTKGKYNFETPPLLVDYEEFK